MPSKYCAQSSWHMQLPRALRCTDQVPGAATVWQNGERQSCHRGFCWCSAVPTLKTTALLWWCFTNMWKHVYDCRRHFWWADIYWLKDWSENKHARVCLYVPLWLCFSCPWAKSPQLKQADQWHTWFCSAMHPEQAEGLSFKAFCVKASASCKTNCKFILSFDLLQKQDAMLSTLTRSVPLTVQEKENACNQEILEVFLEERLKEKYIDWPSMLKIHKEKWALCNSYVYKKCGDFRNQFLICMQDAKHTWLSSPRCWMYKILQNW